MPASVCVQRGRDGLRRPVAGRGCAARPFSCVAGCPGSGLEHNDCPCRPAIRGLPPCSGSAATVRAERGLHAATAASRAAGKSNRSRRVPSRPLPERSRPVHTARQLSLAPQQRPPSLPGSLRPTSRQDHKLLDSWPGQHLRVGLQHHRQQLLLGTTVAGGTYTVESASQRQLLGGASDDSALPLVTYASGYYASVRQVTLLLVPRLLRRSRSSPATSLGSISPCRQPCR